MDIAGKYHVCPSRFQFGLILLSETCVSGADLVFSGVDSGSLLFFHGCVIQLFSVFYLTMRFFFIFRHFFVKNDRKVYLFFNFFGFSTLFFKNRGYVYG